MQWCILVSQSAWTANLVIVEWKIRGEFTLPCFETDNLDEARVAYIAAFGDGTGIDAVGLASQDAEILVRP